MSPVTQPRVAPPLPRDGIPPLPAPAGEFYSDFPCQDLPGPRCGANLRKSGYRNYCTRTWGSCQLSDASFSCSGLGGGGRLRGFGGQGGFGSGHPGAAGGPGWTPHIPASCSCAFPAGAASLLPEWERGLDPGLGAVGGCWSPLWGRREAAVGLVGSHSRGDWMGCSLFLLSAPGQSPGPDKSWS